MNNPAALVRLASTPFPIQRGPIPKPDRLLDRWQRELVSVLATPDVRDELVKHGLTPVPGSREALAATIAAESLAWGKLIRARKIVGE